MGPLLAWKNYYSVLPKHPHKFTFLPEGLAPEEKRTASFSLVSNGCEAWRQITPATWRCCENSFSNSPSFSKGTYENKTKRLLNSLFSGPTWLQKNQQRTREKFQQKLPETGKNRTRFMYIWRGTNQAKSMPRRETPSLPRLR